MFYLCVLLDKQNPAIPWNLEKTACFEKYTSVQVLQLLLLSRFSRVRLYATP